MPGDSMRLCFSFSMPTISIWNPSPLRVQITLHYSMCSTLKFYCSYQNSCACFQKWLMHMWGRVIFRNATPEIVILESQATWGAIVSHCPTDSTSGEHWLIQVIEETKAGGWNQFQRKLCLELGCLALRF